MRDDDKTVWMDCEYVHKTERAVLLRIEGEEVWIPKSQIGVFNTDCTRVELTQWIAEQKGLV